MQTRPLRMQMRSELSKSHRALRQGRKAKTGTLNKSYQKAEYSNNQ